MRLERWHYGKLIILWTWGAVVTAVLFYAIPDPEPDDSVASILGIVLIVGMFLVPACLSVVTWKWLGALESGSESSKDRSKSTHE